MKGISLKLFPVKFLCPSLFGKYEYIYIYSCCAVGQRTAAADLLSKSSCLHVFNYYDYLNL